MIRTSLLAALLLAPSLSPAADAVAVVDWTRTEGTVNRALFSTQGFMQVVVEENPMVMDAFLLTNPAGTHTRVETYIHQLEPENDNDDPNVFDWSRLHPEKSVRFIDDRATFDATLERYGMEPMSLLCYNAPWLQTRVRERPFANPDEWVEFAAAVVESYNGRGEGYRPNLRYIEVWNEPNMEMFYDGDMASYFDLFERTADRIHRDYPGVMVGGPALTHAWHCQPKEWMDAFLAGPAKKADFVTYHHYGPADEPLSVLADDVKDHARRFRALPSKEKGRVALTELDAWFDGWPKVRHVMGRQFMFLELSDYILSIHHFCCMAYNESGNYTFGIVDENGGTIEGTFRPYWLFRNLIGDLAYTQTTGARAADLKLAASRDERDATLLNAVFHNPTDAPMAVDARLYFAPADEDRVLAWDALRPSGYGVERVERVPAKATERTVAIVLGAGESVSLRLHEVGARHFDFRDMNNQVHPWIAATADDAQVGYKDTVRIDAEILNTTFEAASGTLRVGGLPTGWTATLAEGDAAVKNLAFGERHRAAFDIATNALVPGGWTAPFVWLDKGGADMARPDDFAHSVPVRLIQHAPFSAVVLPDPVHADADGRGTAWLQVENDTDDPLPVAVSASGGFSTTATVAPRGRSRIELAVLAKESGAAKVAFEVLGERHEKDLRVEPGFAPVAGATPIDLSAFLNFDPTSFQSKRDDYDGAMGMFAFPADWMPSNATAVSRGVPFRFADLAEGRKNAVLPQGQSIPVPSLRASGVALLGFGHDGAHAGTWRLRYADGTAATVESRIPEWCTPPPEGFAAVFHAPHRHLPAGVSGPPCELFQWTLPADATRELVAVEFPKMEDAYVFAMTALK